MSDDFTYVFTMLRALEVGQSQEFHKTPPSAQLVRTIDKFIEANPARHYDRYIYPDKVVVTRNV
jgi:hypothetical protein